MLVKYCRTIAAVSIAVVLSVAPVTTVYGQNQPPAPPQQPAAPAGSQNPAPVQAQLPTPFRIAVGPDYTRPKSPFPHIFAPYSPIQVDQPQFVNSPRIDQLIRDGKLQLSVQDAIDLALENNLDISVQRYWSWMAETDLLRTKGGGTQRGATVSNVPIAFANLPTLSFDPILTGTLSLDTRKFPVNNPLTSGVGTNAAVASNLSTHTEIANFQYAQAFHTGTTMALALNTTRSSTTSPSVFYNPAVQSTGTLTFSQQLLNGFGLLANERYIRMAVITKKAVDDFFLQTLITDITAVENDYWELVFARGNVEVSQQAVNLAQQLYEDNQRQVQIGTLAPIEVVRAEAQLATAQQQLIDAQTNQLQRQIILMSVITKNPASPDLNKVEIVPTDTIQTPAIIENIALADAVNEALAKRPDVLQARTTIEGDDLNIKATHNALLPSLTFSAFASGAGLNGNHTTPATAPTAANPAGTPLIVATGGFTDAASTVFRGTLPEYSAQLALNLPVRNRVAQADSARALLTQRQDQARLQQTVSNVVVDVQNAQITLQQSRAALTAAQKARVLQEQTLDAEQRKLQLGASTIFVVVQSQQQLSAAAAAEVRAAANLVEAKVNFERAMGRTLEVNSITVANALSGTTPHETRIPGTSLTGELVRPNQASEASPAASR